MVDTLPDLQPSVLPAIEEEIKYKDETAEHLGNLTFGASQAIEDAAAPASLEAAKAMVDSKGGEDRVRKAFSAYDNLKTLSTFDNAMIDMVIKGAKPDQVQALFDNREKLDDPDRSVLERKASEFLINKGMQEPVRAAIVAKEEEEANLLDPTMTDIMQETLTTMQRLGTIREKLADRFQKENLSQNTLDMFTMGVVPFYTSATSAQVMGRKNLTLGQSILTFSQEFWNKPLNQRLNALDKFEKDLTDSLATGNNTLMALTQLEQLTSFREEQKGMQTATEALDAVVVGQMLSAWYKGIKSISGAAKAAGALDVVANRSSQLKQDVYNGRRLSVNEENELVDNSLPTAFSPQAVNLLDMDNAVRDLNAQRIAEKVGPLPRAKTSILDYVGPKAYHGTKANFSVFKETNDIGFHFSTDRKTAEVFSGDDGRVVEAELKIKKPLLLPDIGNWQPFSLAKTVDELNLFPEDKLYDRVLKAHDNSGTFEKGQELASQAIWDYLREKGYDSISYRNTYEGDKKLAYIVSSDNQIIRKINKPQGPATSISLDTVNATRELIAGKIDEATGLSKLQISTSERPMGLVTRRLQEDELIKQWDTILPSLMKTIEDEKLILDGSKPTDLLAALKDVVSPEVLNAEEQGAANIAAIKQLLKDFKMDPEVEEIINPEKFSPDPKLYPAYDVAIDEVNGVRTVSVYLGHGEGKLKPFVSIEAANAGAERLGLDKRFYSVAQKPSGYYIQVKKNAGLTEFLNPLAEKEPYVLPLVGRFLQGSATISKESTKQGARLAVNASSKLKKEIDKSLRNITTLRGDSRESYNMLMADVQFSERWKTFREVRAWYQNMYSRQPTAAELSAYQSTRHIHEFDYVVRNGTYRAELVNRGYEEVLLKGVTKGPIVGKEVVTTSVEPRLIRIYDHQHGGIKVYDTREELKRRFTASPNDVLVKSLEGGKKGDYFIVPRSSVNKRPLRAQILNKIDGPHRIYDTGANGGFIKQQTIRTVRGKDVMYSPRTHFAIDSQRAGLKFAQDYNEALTAYKKAKGTGLPQDKLNATRVINTKTRFADFDEFDRAVLAGRIEPTPFEFRKPGQLPEHDLDKLKDATLIDPDFASLSDELKAMIEQGRMYYSKRGPRLDHPRQGQAALLKPNEILARAISNVVHTQAFRNYQTREITAWVNKWGPYLKSVDKDASLMDKFTNGVFDETLTGERPLPRLAMDQAKAQRMAIQRLLSANSPLGQEAERWRQSVIDLIDGKGHTKTAKGFDKFSSTDTQGFFREVVFKTHIGLLDVSQLILQLSTAPGLAAVSPIQGMKAITSYPMIRAALLDPSRAAALGKLNEKLTLGAVKANQFERLIKDIKKSGVDIIDGNLAERDNLVGKGNIPGFLGDKIRKGTDALSFAYNEGEKGNRVTGFATAWFENHKVTGKGLDTAEDFARVGVRGNTFASNMARDGKAWFQDGYLGLATQFAGHPFRVAELLLHPSSGFTAAEKVRYYAGLGLVYGPTLGLGTGWAVEWFKDKYYDSTGKEANETAVNGFTKGLMGILFPDTDTSRFQPWGQKFLLQDFFVGDEGISAGTFLGPAGDLGSRFVNATVGSAKFWAFLKGDLDFSDRILMPMDIAHDTLKSIWSAYNRADKAVHAYQMKQYLSTRGDVLAQDIDTWDAAMIALGFPPMESSEAFDAKSYLDDYKKKVFKDSTLAAQYLIKAMQAEEGSSQRERNIMYAQYLRDINSDRNFSSDGGELFAKNVDQILSRNGSHNELVFEQYQMTFGRTRNELIREKK